MASSPETEVVYQRGGGAKRNRAVEEFVNACAKPPKKSERFIPF